MYYEPQKNESGLDVSASRVLTRDHGGSQDSVHIAA